jgi:hypothetical protein
VRIEDALVSKRFFELCGGMWHASFVDGLVAEVARKNKIQFFSELFGISINLPNPVKSYDWLLKTTDGCWPRGSLL